MALDIFNRQQTIVQETFTADRAVLAAVGGSGSIFVKSMVQNVQGNYQLPERLIDQLGSNAVARAVGRPRGQLSIGMIMSSKSSGDDRAFFDACNGGATLTLRAVPSACSASSSALTMYISGATAVNVGFVVDAGDLLVRRNVVLSFISYNEIVG